MEKCEYKHWLFYFTLFNCIFWALLGIVYAHIGGVRLSVLSLLFAGAFVLGHLLIFAVLLYSSAFFTARVHQRLAFSRTINKGTFLTMFFLVDLFMFAKYQYHINFSRLHDFLVETVSSFNIILILGLILAWVFIMALETFFLWLAVRIKWWNRTFAYTLTAAFIFCFIGYNIALAYSRFAGVEEITKQENVLPLSYSVNLDGVFSTLGFTPAAHEEQEEAKTGRIEEITEEVVP